MIKIQGTVREIFANKMVTTNLGHPVYSVLSLYLSFLSWLVKMSPIVVKLYMIGPGPRMVGILMVVRPPITSPHIMIRILKTRKTAIMESMREISFSEQEKPDKRKEASIICTPLETLEIAFLTLFWNTIL